WKKGVSNIFVEIELDVWMKGVSDSVFGTLGPIVLTAVTAEILFEFRGADIILALATNALKSSASKDSETQDEVCHSNNDDSNLRSAEDGVENNKVDGLFEPLEEEEYIESGSDRSLFSSDGQEEYQPDLNDLSSSDEDESFTRKVKIEDKEKTRKRKCAFQHNSDEDIIPGTDSDSDRPSYLFQ
ncbi:hypothetical protein J6590_098453, partial [Homalodisca vitripennis]